MLLINRLTKVTNDPIVQDAGAVNVVGVGSNENCRNREPCIGEVSVGIAEATVKVHRSRAMQKMKAGSLAELGRMADKLKLVSDEPQRA